MALSLWTVISRVIGVGKRLVADSFPPRKVAWQEDIFLSM